MLTINSFVVPSDAQWDMVINGMRNPLNSWDRKDSDGANLGLNDKNLMIRLIHAGNEHRKFLRQLPVIVSVTAPLYLWKELDTYKVGTVSNSCSTMHKITAKKFEWSDFSTEHLLYEEGMQAVMAETINILNQCRKLYLKTKSKDWWWQIIQLLPSSYNQTRTLSLNYEILGSIYRQRKGHKLDEWQTFREWMETLPNAFLITEGDS